MSEKSSITKSFFVGIWNVLNFSRRLVLNVIFILIIIGAYVVISSSDDGRVNVKPSSALVLDLKGDLVIQKQYVEPLDAFFDEAFDQESLPQEVLLTDLVKVIENAREDTRIKAIILDLKNFNGGGFDKLKSVAKALEDFKSAGKPVYAISDYYTRNQYFVAAHADNVYLHPMGGMLIEGYSRYRNFYAEGLEKIKANVHVFKVGKYKSAVEPFLRNDMSPEAKEANVAWMDGLWKQYKQAIAEVRGFEESNFDETFDGLIAKFSSVEGNFAQYALQNNWVDGLRTREEFRSEISELLGKGHSDQGYNYVNYDKYLDLISPHTRLPTPTGDKVAVIVAKGNILNGNQEPGAIGGDSTAQLLRKARLNNEVKAVVLQVDSGGGSAFASEVIRKEVESIQKAGKPVVASMGSVAASGGYWISASADHIMAEPSTITGSIGIFGLFLTLENAFNYLGIYTDGVATNELSGISPDRPLKDGYAQLIQMNIEHGYDQFISLVADERDMTKEDVDEIAQGRVWIGTQALELGLVDSLGSLQDAINKAAELASIDQFKTYYIERQLSDRDRLMQQFLDTTSSLFEGGIAKKPSILSKMTSDIERDIDSIVKLNDPQYAYALCHICEVE